MRQVNLFDDEQKRRNTFKWMIILAITWLSVIISLGFALNGCGDNLSSNPDAGTDSGFTLPPPGPPPSCPIGICHNDAG